MTTLGDLFRLRRRLTNIKEGCTSFAQITWYADRFQQVEEQMGRLLEKAMRRRSIKILLRMVVQLPDEVKHHHLLPHLSHRYNRILIHAGIFPMDSMHVSLIPILGLQQNLRSWLSIFINQDVKFIMDKYPDPDILSQIDEKCVENGFILPVFYPRHLAKIEAEMSGIEKLNYCHSLGIRFLLILRPMVEKLEPIEGVTYHFTNMDKWINFREEGKRNMRCRFIFHGDAVLTVYDDYMECSEVADYCTDTKHGATITTLHNGRYHYRAELRKLLRRWRCEDLILFVTDKPESA